MAKDILTVETIENEKLAMVSGKSMILRSALPVKRVSIADPEIADFILLSPQEIYLTGKGAGTTSLTIWQDKKVTAIFDIEVAYDLSQLKQHLHAILPEEKDIRVIATNDSITLSGKISSAANLSQALALVNAYAPEGKINNLVQVGGVHQVMLEVRVAEMSRSLTRRLGINFAAQKGNEFAVSLIGGVAQLESLAAGPSIFPSSAVNALFRFNTGSVTWTAVVDALKEDGLVKILAEPTLITLSGQSADFLAGGEFPVPVPQGLGTVAIEYKPFGVGLLFTPTVLSKDKISIQVTPEVSELDFTTAVLIEGFAVPGLTTRRASTTVELADGKSFAIAGLLKETVRDIVSKFPVLGDIPILGALFRSRSFQKNETELVIIVTPHLVKPIDLAQQTLPTDFYVEPNDFELYLEGRMEGRPRGQTTLSGGVLDGDFGHTIPDE
jgi:pilus assembly protein CpaC